VWVVGSLSSANRILIFFFVTKCIEFLAWNDAKPKGVVHVHSGQPLQPEPIFVKLSERVSNHWSRSCC
jgi:hypothetical protein